VSVSDDGIVSCRGLGDGQSECLVRYAALLIYADGRLHFLSTEGENLTIASGRRFRKLAESELGEGFMASPAVVGGQLILRSKSIHYGVKANWALAAMSPSYFVIQLIQDRVLLPMRSP
jgi:outer membrane protein assembly factor BamB